MRAQVDLETLPMPSKFIKSLTFDFGVFFKKFTIRLSLPFVITCVEAIVIIEQNNRFILEKWLDKF